MAVIRSVKFLLCLETLMSSSLGLQRSLQFEIQIERMLGSAYVLY